MYGLRVGANVNNYRVLKKLGQGGMGAVYKVQDVETGEIRAMKVVDPATADRFRSEAQALAALRHPNVIRFHGMWPMPDGSLALLMDFVVGEDFGSRFQELPLNESIRLLHQVAMGLDYCHSKRVVHRDMKPANIMIAESDGQLHALIVDFGLGKDRNLGGPTELNMAAGTPPFMPPEQLEDFAHAGSAADQWSLAVCAWIALTGSYPFPRAPRDFSGRPRATQVQPRLPADVNSIFDRAFQMEAVKRFATCVNFTLLLGAAFGLQLPSHPRDFSRQVIKERVRPLVPDHDFSESRSEPLWGYGASRLADLLRQFVASRKSSTFSVQGVNVKVRVLRDSMVIQLTSRQGSGRLQGGTSADVRIRELEDLGWQRPRGIARPWSLTVPLDHNPGDTAERVLEALRVGFDITVPDAIKDL